MRGEWQVYAKDVRGVWLPIGRPATRARAEELVATLRAEGRMKEPHAVPL